MKTFITLIAYLAVFGVLSVQASKLKKFETAPGIAGGSDAKPGQFPHVVSIQLTNGQDGFQKCGGVLVSPEWVLTTASCLDSEKPDWLWVVTGDTVKDTEEETEQVLTVDRLVQHEEYTHWLKPAQHDIGMLHLNTSAKLDDFTKVADLAEDETKYEETCTEAGWGKKSTEEEYSKEQQFAEVPLLESSKCKEAYKLYKDVSLCAGNLEGGVGFCEGDNGGPLMCTSVAKDSSPVVAGIMSYRSGCASEAKPGVYTNVALYGEWMKTVMESENVDPEE